MHTYRTSHKQDDYLDVRQHFGIQNDLSISLSGSPIWLSSWVSSQKMSLLSSCIGKKCRNCCCSIGSIHTPSQHLSAFQQSFNAHISHIRFIILYPFYFILFLLGKIHPYPTSVANLTLYFPPQSPSTQL